jgi:CBS domain containing-hemolysin-like protein
LAREIEFLPDSVTVLYLINHLVRNKLHLVGVLNEYGDYIGIVTLEDAMETLLGAEIVDEFDTVEDMQKLAKDSLKKSLAKDSRPKKK